MDTLSPEILGIIFANMTTKTLKRSCRKINRYIGGEARNIIRARRLEVYHTTANRIMEQIIEERDKRYTKYEQDLLFRSRFTALINRPIPTWRPALMLLWFMLVEQEPDSCRFADLHQYFRYDEGRKYETLMESIIANREYYKLDQRARHRKSKLTHHEIVAVKLAHKKALSLIELLIT